ncbi:hypothetical protein [Hymenobacter latericus]|uniref:hypothetical protein n=1 Tax=Hymenobacter sp. YIM 151858-1 TaxID=2987688 RepID=UPI002225E15C|nr:hypothetical protein [Hymenobacter sp. YIM 151858-1]UYZ60141.1 hypothetical protein OIS50_04900 [Hymenobacter sp. YIM 151858-1]
MVRPLTSKDIVIDRWGVLCVRGLMGLFHPVIKLRLPKGTQHRPEYVELLSF